MHHESLKVAAIFEREPVQWGLRGDPYFWQALKAHFQQVPLPYAPEALRQDVLEIFNKLTGAQMQAGQTYYLQAYASPQGGMSSGMISGDFWLETGIPELMHRLKKLNATMPVE